MGYWQEHQQQHDGSCCGDTSVSQPRHLYTDSLLGFFLVDTVSVLFLFRLLRLGLVEHFGCEGNSCHTIRFRGACTCFLRHIRNHRFHLKRAQPIQSRSQYSCLAWGKDGIAVFIHLEHSYVGHLVESIVGQSLAQLVHLTLNPAQGFRITYIVGFNVRLHKKRVVDFELRVESECAQWGQEHTVSLVVTRFHMMCCKPAKSWNNDTVVVE